MIRLNCDKCEFNDNCDIKTAYHKAKDYAAVSMEFVNTPATMAEMNRQYAHNLVWGMKGE